MIKTGAAPIEREALMDFLELRFFISTHFIAVEIYRKAKKLTKPPVSFQRQVASAPGRRGAIFFVKVCEGQAEKISDMAQGVSFKHKLRRTWTQLRERKHVFLAAIVAIALLGGFGLSRVFHVPVKKRTKEIAEQAKNQSGNLFHELFMPVEHAYHSAQKKLETLARAEEENEKLRLENAHLRLRTEELQLDCHAQEAANNTKDYQVKLANETGSRVGRAIASIAYKPPGHMLPQELYTLGISYFKSREDEKAAVIISFLTGLEENDAFKTARNYLMAGVAWYRLDNNELADLYLDHVLKTPDEAENAVYQAQARLWKALVAERSGKHTKAQYWLRELIDYHPYSTEATWVNYGSRPTRMPAAAAPAAAAPASEQEAHHATAHHH